MRPSFFNDGLNISYPFVHEPEGLPDWAIVDFGSLLRSGSAYTDGTDSVYLAEIRRQGSTLTFEFKSTAPGLAGRSLVFSRDVSDVLYVSSYADDTDSGLVCSAGQVVESSTSSEESSTSSLVDDCQADALWSGYLVSGDMQQLADLLADGECLSGPWTVEPARQQNLDKSYVRSLNVANAERTRATAKEDCRDYCWPFELAEHYVACTCLLGDVRFQAGYNLNIRQDDANVSLVFDAEVGAGAGEPCEEQPLFATEGPPTGRTLLDGALGCGEVVRSINGVGRRFFQVTGGQGVIITPVPEEHRLIVNVGLHDMALCPDLIEQSSTVPLPENDDSCECGPA